MSFSELTAFEKSVVAALSSEGTVAGRLMAAWAKLPAGSHMTAKSITALAQLGVTEERRAQEILVKASNLKLLEAKGQGFVSCQRDTQIFYRLSFALGVIGYYEAQIHQDATTAKIVLTRPPRPSVLEDELAQLGWRTADIEPTEQAFYGMVQAAESRVVVMTPFFDVKGAMWLKELFSQVRPGCRRTLLLRNLDEPHRPDYPVGYDSIASWLHDESVEIFDYTIPRSDGAHRETFHAKVVLCDEDVAYVGSSNLTGASLEHSMEMGITVKGKAGADVAVVIEAVLKAANRFA